MDYGPKYVETTQITYLEGVTADTPNSEKAIIFVPNHMRVTMISGIPVDLGKDYDSIKFAIRPGMREITIEHVLWGEKKPITLKSKILPGKLVKLTFELEKNLVGQPVTWGAWHIDEGDLNPTF